MDFLGQAKWEGAENIHSAYFLPLSLLLVIKTNKNDNEMMYKEPSV
jgi:hypothetical protein